MMGSLWYKGYKNDLVIGDRVLFYYGLKDGQTFFFENSEDPAKSVLGRF